MQKITALITTYKRPKLLKRAINSVLSQTYQNFKILISDDFSDDLTSEIVKTYLNDDRIEYHCSQSNKGEKSSISFLFSNITTPYFSIIHDDDGIEKNMFNKAIEILDNNVDIGVVVFQTLAIDVYGNLIQTIDLNGEDIYYRDDSKIDAWSEGKVPITWTSMVFRKELAKLWFETDLRFEPGPDIKFLIRVLSKNNFCVVNKIGGFCTLQSGTISDGRSLYGLDLEVLGMSRYLEVLYDNTTNEYVKRWAMVNISKMYNQNVYKNYTKRIIKEYIRWCCGYLSNFDKSLKDYFYFLEIEKKYIMLIILNILKKSFSKKITRIIFYNYYSSKRKKILLDAQNDQIGKYADLFKFIKANT